RDTSRPTNRSFSDNPDLHWPRFAAITHVPEHPLVAAGRDEGSAHRVALIWREPRRGLVGSLDHTANHDREFLRRVRLDPFLIERVGRAFAFQLLPHLPVDPIAGKQRANGLMKWRAIRGREKEAGVCEIRRS